MYLYIICIIYTGGCSSIAPERSAEEVEAQSLISKIGSRKLQGGCKNLQINTVDM